MNDVMTLTVTLLLLLLMMMMMTHVRVVTSVFQSSSGVPSEFHIAEEMPAGTLLGSVRDNPQLEAIDNSNHSNSLRFGVRHCRAPSLADEYFTVEPQTGEIRTRQSVDREQVCLPATRTCSIVFDVLVRPLKYFQIVRVIVYIEDTNDNAPTFPQQRLTLHIKESSLPGSTFPLPVATDADSGVFGIEGFELRSSSVELFALEVRRNVDESFELRLKLTASLDRESASYHEMRVVAFDGGHPRRSGTLEVVVTVTDANDHSPQFTSDSYHVEMVENQLPSSAIVRVEASDDDDGQNSQLVYSLAEFSETQYGELFRVDAVTGEVFLRRALDREAQSVYRLTLSVTDGGRPARSAFTRLVVGVVDENDNSPRLLQVSSADGDRRLRVMENSEPRTFIAYISATDDDLASAGTVDCYVRGPQLRLEPLYSGAQSAEYKLLSAVTFDRELESTVLATLTCRDRARPTSRSVDVELVVEVQDDNDHSPLIDSDVYQVEMAEGNEVGAHVVDINATDADTGENAQLTFTLTRVGATPERGLSIDGKTGSVTADTRLDYETCRLYEYVVTVCDAGEVERTSTASLVLHVTDTDDEPPQFHQPAYYFSVPEDAPVGTLVGHVQATDGDVTPAFSEVLYEQCGAGGPFSVDRTSGELRTTGQLDRERQNVYELTVSASDTSDVPTTVHVAVHVRDINDNAPVFVSPSQTTSHIIYLSSHLPAGYVLIR